MSQWNPIWKLEINGVDYTNLILSNLIITSGRTDIYSQANAGYCNIELINLDQTNYTFAINQSISISVQDSTATFVPIHGQPTIQRSNGRMRKIRDWVKLTNQVITIWQPDHPA
jgi:hypothetical protein